MRHIVKSYIYIKGILRYHFLPRITFINTQKSCLLTLHFVFKTFTNWQTYRKKWHDKMTCTFHTFAPSKILTSVVVTAECMLNKIILRIMSCTNVPDFLAYYSCKKVQVWQLSLRGNLDDDTELRRRLK